MAQCIVKFYHLNEAEYIYEMIDEDWCSLFLLPPASKWGRRCWVRLADSLVLSECCSNKITNQLRTYSMHNLFFLPSIWVDLSNGVVRRDVYLETRVFCH